MNLTCVEGNYMTDEYGGETLHVPYSFIAVLRHGERTPRVSFDPTELAKGVLELRENRSLLREAVDSGSIVEVLVSRDRVGRISDWLQAGEELPALLEATEEFWFQREELADSRWGWEEDDI